MRARIAGYVALTPLLFVCAQACEGVPDLRFAGSGDGAAPGSASTVDATLIDLDSAPPAASSGGSGSSSGGASEDASTFADATGPLLPLDSSSPPPASDGAPTPPTGCPSHPPAGTTCCGAVACKGTAMQCNCNDCAFCAQEGFCCPSTHPPPGFCATSLAACH